ncbi:hypothetical protein PHLGIDRAFT_416083 [Phlebiopsis gigantea 11061_1 CR5-6]|uniref:TERF2-interacting telomeric protein 1 Myb domain-containing protein n=1 Tax=Phlebiopsis gigantea (strain 11061_1 CR5-6) TaxID=745531 RepID=A0A0C3RZ19_PHLG1|nr:hypothetical protein PHLGIDRAFT_416083 [Phlebiopsis gigantea 11061_1 CR5-6]
MSKDEVHDQKSYKFLSQFLARYDPDGAFRDDLDIYERLTNNDVRFLRTRIAAPPSATQKFEDPWPQRKMYTAEQWLEFYRRYKLAVDTKAQEFQQRWAEADGKHGPLKPVSSSQRKKQQSSAVPSTPRSTQRTPFTPKDDANLIQWLAIEHPAQKGRKSAALYERLMSDTTLWPWARRHPADSWRERYRKNTTRLDRAIEKYQQNHGIDPVDPRDHTDKHPRHDIWAKVPGLSAVEDSPRSQPGASSQNDKVASTSKQTSAPVKPPNTKHTPVSQETRRDGRAEEQDIVPRHSERAQEKHRVLPHEGNAEEEEEEEEELQKQRQREDEELPVLLESPEEEADDYAEEIARDPGVEDDEAGPMEEDQHAQTSVREEQPMVQNDSAQSDPREPEAQDVRDTQELLDVAKQPLWATLPQDHNETEAEEDEDVDELDPSPQYAPSYSHCEP